MNYCCPICSGTSFLEWGKVQKYSILKCEECGMGMTTPFPTPEQLIESNKRIYDVEQRVQIYMTRQNYFENRYKRYLRHIKKIKTNGYLLDVGCSVGLFMKVAQQAGYVVMGLEINDDCAQYGREKFHLNIDSKHLKEIASPDETFDVVTLFDVLEHVHEEDISQAVAECQRVSSKYILHKIYTQENSWLSYFYGSDLSLVSVYSKNWWEKLWQRLKYKIVSKHWFWLPDAFDTSFLLKK